MEINAQRSDHTSLELIREVAAEVGISETALNEALRERAMEDRAEGALVERTLQLMPSVPVFGLGVGVIFLVLRPFMEVGPLHADAVVALWVMAATTLMLALRRLPESPQRRDLPVTGVPRRLGGDLGSTLPRDVLAAVRPAHRGGRALGGADPGGHHHAVVRVRAVGA